MLVIAGILGFGTDLLLKNSHTDFFPGYIKWKASITEDFGNGPVQISCADRGGTGLEDKSISLLAIEQQKERPDGCIEEIGLSRAGYGLYLLMIVVIPLLIGYWISTKVVKKKK